MQNCNLGLFCAAPIPLVQHTELGVLYKIRTEMRIALLYRGGRCPHSKGQMSTPSYKLDAIFLFRGQTNLAMRHMFEYSMKKVF